MKSIKFLAALAIPAMFAACTNEELAAVQQEGVQQGEEFVGAELIGKGISLNVSSNSDSRISANGEWTGADKLGLGWVVNGTYADDQIESADPNDNKLYGNHLFYYNEEKGDFNTMANIYTGWHFAYYPFTHMQKLGNAKVVEVNPVQNEEWATDKFNSCLNLSARVFLSPKNLDEETYQLKDVRFAPVRVFNTIGINIQPNETFTTKANLSGLKVKSIKLNVGAGVFAKKVELHPELLAELQYDNETGVYSETMTKNAVRESSANALKVLNSKTKEVETIIGEDLEIDLSGNNTLRFHALPVSAKGIVIDPKEVKFTVYVEGGEFNVQYPEGVAEDSEDAVAKSNWETIQALVKAYAKDGEMTKVGTALYNKESATAEGLSLQLTEGMFEPNFKEITSEEDWIAAVKIADALGMENVEFNVVNANGLVFNNIDKDEENGDADLINLPEGNLTVTGDKLVLNAEGTWPVREEGKEFVVETAVEVKAYLTVTDGAEMIATGGITNNGTIDAGYLSHINGVDNKGEITVVYGSYVTIKAGGEEGVISYEVPAVSTELSEAKIQEQIEFLIASTGNTEDCPYANVNKLIVNENVALNLTIAGSTTSGSEAKPDPYRPVGAGKPTTTASRLIQELNGVSFEINGGEVSSTETATVKSAIVKGGSLINVNVTNGVSVEGTSTNKAQVVAGNIAGGLTATYAEVTVETSIEGSVNATNATITATSTNGTVSAKNSNISVASISGAVTTEGETTITGAEFASSVTIENGVTTLNNVKINGTLTIKAGAKVILNNSVAATSIHTLVNNGTLVSNNNIIAVDVNLNPGSWTTMDDANVTGYDKVIYYSGNYYNEDMTLQGKVTSIEEKAFADALAEVAEGGTITLYNDLTLDNWTAVTKDVVLDLNGKTLTLGNIHVNSKMTIKNGTVASQLYVAADATFENVKFQIAGNQTNHEGSLQIASGNVTLTNCTFNNSATYAGRQARPLLTNDKYNGKLELNGCTFLKTAQSYPTINPVGSSAEIILTGNTFNEIVCFEFEGEESQFSIVDNQFKSLDFTGSSDPLSKACADFCTKVLAENDFVGGSYDIAAYVGSKVIEMNK